MNAIGPDLLALVICDQDGLVIDSRLKPGFNDKVLGGLSAAVQPVIQRIKQEFGWKGKFGIGSFDTEHARLIFCEAGPQAMVILVGGVYSYLDYFFPYCYLLAEKVARILDGRPCWLDIPTLSLQSSHITGAASLSRLSLDADTYVAKVILAGEGGVGKTTLVHQFVEMTFAQDYKETIGVSLMQKQIFFPEWNTNVRFTIYDVGGQTIFARVRQTYFQGALAGFIVYDVTRPETFLKVRDWFDECKHAEPQIQLILIGNKIDLKEQRRVTNAQGRELAAKLGISFFETTAIDFDRVLEAFKAMAFLLFQFDVKAQKM